jgi:four helix bundle protein
MVRLVMATRSLGMPHHDNEKQLAWERACPETITSDVLWRLDAYRVAMYLLHTTQQDFRPDQVSRADPWLITQLVRAAGSISANLSEGYSRATRADRLRFLGYALSSTRECIPWYESLRDVLSDSVVEERIELVARLRSLLLGFIRSLREDGGVDSSRLEH